MASTQKEGELDICDARQRVKEEGTSRQGRNREKEKEGWEKDKSTPRPVGRKKK